MEAAIAVEAIPCANWRRLILFMIPPGAKALLFNGDLGKTKVVP